MKSRILVLNLFLAITCAAWLVLVQVSGAGSGRWAFAALALFGLLDVLIVAFLWSQGLRAATLGSVAAWVLAAGWSANLLVAGSAEDNIYKLDPEVGWMPRPGLDAVVEETRFGPFEFTTDRFGARNLLPYPEDRHIRYAVQGDSNLYGVTHRYEETLTARLNARSASGDYFNFGVPGYDVNHFYFQFRRLARELDIGTRLVFFNIGNDFTYSPLTAAYGNRRPYLEVVDGEVLAREDNFNRIPRQAYGRRFTSRYSRFDPLVASPPDKDWAGRFPSWLEQVPLFQFLAMRFYAKVTEFGGDERPADAIDVSYPDWLLLSTEAWPEPFRLYLEDFEAILAELKRQHADTLLVLFPMRKQVIPAELEQALARLRDHGHPSAEFDPPSLNRELAEMAARQQIGLLDLYPVFVADERPQTLYQPDDDHLSARGLDLSAASILDWLKPE